MSQIPSAVEKWTGKVEEVELGATSEEGGTRKYKLKVGGVSTLPFLHFDGSIPNKVVVGMEVCDIVPEYPEVLKETFEHYLGKPVEWAKFCVKEGAEIICIKLKSLSPEGMNAPIEDGISVVESILKAVDVPLLVYGCGDEEKDSKFFQECGEILKKERCAIGQAEQEKYKSISVASMAYDAPLIAFSNLDINLAKQLNIMLTDFGVKKNKIIMDPLQGALGYGLEYSYSVIERIRLAALQGDSMLQMPIMCNTAIAWSAREAYEKGYMSNPSERGTMWEATTALSAIMAGADILIMLHPKAVRMIKNTIEHLSAT